MEARRAERIAEGELPDAELEPAERAIAALVRRSTLAPAALGPADLAPVVRALGPAGALEVLAMLGHFHFVTRVADLVGIDAELPLVQRRFRWLRKRGVRVQAALLRRVVDLRNRRLDVDADALLAELESLRGEALPRGAASLRLAPGALAWAHRLARAVPVLRPDLYEAVTQAVAAALPASEEDVVGFHERPADALEALCFVGTRYAARTTDALLDAVRASRALDDGALTEVFFAIGVRNAFERVDRLLAAPVGA